MSDTQLSTNCVTASVAQTSLLQQPLALCHRFRAFAAPGGQKSLATIGIIYELLLARSGLGVISSLSVADMDFIIHYLCVCRGHSFYHAAWNADAVLR